MIHQFIRASLALCTVLILSASVHAEKMNLPFGMTTDHLNLVLSINDEAKVHEFYGEVLGLKRIPNLVFPGNMHMVRYMGGKTEIKFIVTNQDLPEEEGGTKTARGIRLMAIFLPDTEKSAITKRLKEKGYEVPSFTSGPTYQYGMTYDAEGNQVELVFFDNTTDTEKFKGFQIGLTVSDADAMNKFLSNIIGLEKIREITTDSGLQVHYYGMGHSGVKFWEGKDDLPAWVGGPFDVRGMNLVQFLVPNVDAVRAKVLERGGHIHTEPFALGKMATIMFVDGPDGILFEFAGPLLDRLK